MSLVCPFAASGAKQRVQKGDDADESQLVSPKCPLGYDSSSFKLGPLSCVICRALLFNATNCLPCRHIFCSGCIIRFKDCPLCGVDITGSEHNSDLQRVVDQFIEGHARIERPLPHASDADSPAVTYEDASVARGSFLLQHAMRAFQAQNLESAKARLELCLDDTREMLSRKVGREGICSQLGAVLGLLGDCLRSMGEMEGAMMRYNESIEVLQNIEKHDAEVVHALSVSLNKVGDLKYYADDLQSASLFYSRALQVREEGLLMSASSPSEVVDIAVSVAKIADVERALGNEVKAIEGFEEAIKKLEEMTTLSGHLEARRASVLDFLHAQMSKNKNKM